MKKPNVQANDYPFLSELEQRIDQILEKKNRVIVAVTGKPGCGKSTFGKFVRKQGFGKYSPLSISVIDDDVMTKDYLFGIVRRKIKITSSQRDDLFPFLKLLPKRKRIVFYINAFPYKRLLSCDILLQLECEETLRRQRLRHRVSDSEKYERLINTIPDIGSLKYRQKVTGWTK